MMICSKRIQGIILEIEDEIKKLRNNSLEFPEIAHHLNEKADRIERQLQLHFNEINACLEIIKHENQLWGKNDV